MTEFFNKKIVIAAMAIANGGLGSYLMNVAEGLKARGWLVHIVATNGRDDLFDVMSKAFSCHDLSTLPLSVRKVIVASNLVNEIAPDVLLLNHCALMHYALPLLSSKTKPVAVLHSNDPRFCGTGTLFSERIFRWIAPSSGLEDRCKSYMPSGLRKRIRLLPHGVREDVFYRDNKKASIGRTIAFVGYLGETKGADLLPDIMRLVLESCPDAKMTVIGEGPLRFPLQERLRQEGMADRCELIGPVSRDVVARRLRESDIFLLPTRIEGFGLAIVEAMLAGAVPVVSLLRGVTDNIIDNGKTGALIEPDDIRGFAETIVHLMKDPRDLRSMSDAAGAVAVERYSAGRMLDAYEALFEEGDDRESTKRRGIFGWGKETISEVMKKGISRQWLVNRIKRVHG